jgi:hypothetical protein
MVKRYSHLVVDHKAKVIEKMVAAKECESRWLRGYAAPVNSHFRPEAVLELSRYCSLSRGKADPRL